MSKSFCNKCGAKLKPDASFCTNCGSVINKNEEIVVSSRANVNSPKDKTGKGLRNILLTIAFSSAVVLAIFYLSNSNKLKQDRSIDDNIIKQVTTVEDSKTESINLNVVSVNFTTLTSAGELIPVICRYSTAKKDSTIIWTIENIGNASQIVNITAEIPGWSNLSEKTIELPSNKTVRIQLNLTYKREFYKNGIIHFEMQL